MLAEIEAARAILSGSHSMATNHAKVCPACGTTCKVDADRCRNRRCKRAFTGGEFGLNPERIRLETDSQVLTDAEIEDRLATLPISAPDDRAARRTDEEYARSALLTWTGGALFCALVLASGWHLVVSSPGQEQFSDNPLAGLYCFIGLVALLVLFVASFAIVERVRWYLHGPQVGSPDKCLETFYSELGVGQPKHSVGRAWICLDPVAQGQFKSMEALEQYWENQLNDLRRHTLWITYHVWSDHRPNKMTGEVGYRLAWEPAWLGKITERAAELHRDLVIEIYDNVEVGTDSEGDRITGTLVYAVLFLLQSKTLLKSGDRWYLTSGSLDGPKRGLL